MSTSAAAIVPVSAAFTSEILNAGEADNIVFMERVGYYLYGLTNSTPAKLIKINRDDFSDRTVVTFANDGVHGAPAGLKYIESKQRLYALLGGGGNFVVSEIHPTTLARTDVIASTATEVIAGVNGLEADTTNIYILGKLTGNSRLLCCPLASLSAANLVVTDLSAHDPADTLHYVGGNLYIIGHASAPPATLIQIETSAFSVVATAPFPDDIGADGPTLMASTGEYIFTTFTDHAGKLWRFKQSNLERTEIATGQNAFHITIASDGVHVWDFYLNGNSVRINSLTSAQHVYALTLGEVMSVLAGDGIYLYTVISGVPSAIFRSSIPPFGTLQWVRQHGSSEPDVIYDLDTNSNGNTIAIGQSGAFTKSTFIKKYSPIGEPLWTINFGLLGTSLAVDDNDNIIFCGSYSGSGAHAGGTVFSNGPGIFIAKFDANGNHLWSEGYPASPGSGSDLIVAVSVGPDLNPVFTGTFSGSINFGGGHVVTGSNAVFVAKFSGTDRSCLWANRFQGTGDINAGSVAVDAANNVVFTGGFAEDADFGGGILSSPGKRSTFLAKYNSSGVYILARHFIGASSNMGFRVATDADGNIALYGEFNYQLDVGGGVMTTSFRLNGYLLVVDSNLVYRWSKHLGSIYGYLKIVGGDVAFDSSGSVCFTGYAIQPWDFGGGEIQPQGDILVVKYDPNGIFRWNKLFGGNMTDIGYAIACDLQDNIITGGSFSGTGDFDGTILTATNTDAVVFKLAP